MVLTATKVFLVDMTLKATILLTLTGVALAAPPLVPEYPSSTTTTTSTTTEKSTTTTTEKSTTSTPTTTTTSTTQSISTLLTDESMQYQSSTETSTSHFHSKSNKYAVAERLSSKTRQYLLQGLPSITEFDQLSQLNLTPKQRLALEQELSYQKLGLPAWSDPTPWQRLSREQQIEFNRKYLALPPDLQEYSRNQFLSLPDARQEKAYHTFVTVDIDTLTRAIQREFNRERLALERRSRDERLQEEQRIQNLLKEKQMMYSAMNAQIITDILDNSIDDNEQGSDLIKLLKEQLSSSLQVAAQDDFDDAIIVTTPHLLPEPSTERPRSQLNSKNNIKFHRINDITEEQYLKSAAPKVSPRVPKSNSSVLSARAALFAKRFKKFHNKVSAEEKRSNIQRLMYDPRRKN